MNYYNTNNIPYPDSRFNIGANAERTPDLLTMSLIVLFHVRFIFLVILDERSIVLDAVFYLLVLAALCTLKLNKYCLVLIPLVFISFINSAASNIFLILSSSYIIADKLPLRKVMKINILCAIGVLLSVVLLVKMGVVKEHIGSSHFYINGAVYNERFRSDLGFGNPNRVAILIYSIIINLYLLIPKHRMKLFLCLVALVSAYIYNITMSRTFVFTIAMFLLSCVGMMFSSFRKFFFKTRMLLFYVPLIFLFSIIYLIKTGYFNLSIEILTSGRLGLFKDLITHCSLQDYLLGTPMINELTIDNSYLHLLFSAGVLGLITAYFLWYKLLKRLNYVTLITYPILSSIALYGFAESIWTMLLCYGNMIIWIMMIKNFLFPEEYQREIQGFYN